MEFQFLHILTNIVTACFIVALLLGVNKYIIAPLTGIYSVHEYNEHHFTCYWALEDNRAILKTRIA